jgi:hypothetical protein
MIYKQTTQVPNLVFDTYLPNLTESELKIILIVIRQTLGWYDKKTGKRKVRDRISGSQFRLKTGLSKRIIIKTIKSLVERNLLQVTDYRGNELRTSSERMGKTYLYFSLAPVHLPTPAGAKSVPNPVHKGEHNKTNYSKLKRTKPRQHGTGHIGTLLPNIGTLFDSHT